MVRGKLTESNHACFPVVCSFHEDLHFLGNFMYIFYINVGLCNYFTKLNLIPEVFILLCTAAHKKEKSAPSRLLQLGNTKLLLEKEKIRVSFFLKSQGKSQGNHLGHRCKPDRKH